MRIPIHIKKKIAWFMSIVKIIIGFRLLYFDSITAILGGTFLMIGGMNHIVPRIFDRIELFLMNKRDPDCGPIKFDAKRGNHDE